MRASADGPGYRVEPLEPRRHDRGAFTCGVGSLDTYLKHQASQDMRRKANAVFVLVRADAPAEIVGYFTLCAYALAPGSVPEVARVHVPRYPSVSATLLGRLAISQRQQGRGLGGMLLVRALRKAYENAHVVGSCMVVVDAIDAHAMAFYEAHGFIRLPDTRRLVLPMRSIANLLGR